MVKPILHSSEEGKLLWETALRLRREEAGRKTPSPSSYSRCTRQVVGKAIGVPSDNEGELDHESWMAANSGGLTEPALHKLVIESGIAEPISDKEWRAAGVYPPSSKKKFREIMPQKLKPFGMKGGQIDDIMRVNDYKGRPSDLPVGSLILVEYKRKGVFGHYSLWKIGDDGQQSGVQGDDSGEMEQAQAYLAILGIPYTLYFSAAWDRSALTWASNAHYVYKKWDFRPSGFYAEWIKAGDPDLLKEAISDRTSMLSSYIKKDTQLADVPRDFNPFADKFPCPYCEIWNACKEAG